MLKNLQDSLKENDKAKRCMIIKIPNRLFFILISPIIIFSPKNLPKYLEFVQIYQASIKPHITKTQPKTFPFKDI